MKKLTYILLVGLLLLTGCQNYFDDEKLDYRYDISDMRTFSYTLSEADYGNLPKDTAIIALAKQACAGDPDSVAYKNLLAIAKQKAFLDETQATQYLPKYIFSKYPQLSEGSVCNVTYNLVEGLPQYVTTLSGINTYALSEADYTTLWAGRNDVPYLTPATIGNLKDVLPDDAVEGDMLVVSYDYRTTEPSQGGGGSDEPQLGFFEGTAEERGYYTATEVKAAYDAGTLTDGTEINVGGVISSWYTTTTKFNPSYGNIDYFVTDKEGTNEFELYRSFSLQSVKWVSFDGTTATDENGETISTGDTIIATGTCKKYDKNGDGSVVIYEFNQNCYLTEIRHAVSPSPAPRRAPALKDGSVTEIYQYTSGSWKKYSISGVELCVLSKDDYNAIGTNSISNKNILATYLASKYPYVNAKDVFAVVYNTKSGITVAEFVFNGTTFVENTGITENTIALALKNSIWNSTTYYKQAIIGEGQGALVIQDVELGGLDYVWSYDAKYGMKGNAYTKAEGAHVVESWVVTPLISLAIATKPVLSFDQAMNYGPDALEERLQECTVLVSEDYSGDVKICHWTPIVFNTDAEHYPVTNDWTFINTGVIDLSAYTGKKIVLGFRYKTLEGQTCITWEFQHLLVAEAEE